MVQFFGDTVYFDTQFFISNSIITNLLGPTEKPRSHDPYSAYHLNHVYDNLILYVDFAWSASQFEKNSPYYRKVTN